MRSRTFLLPFAFSLVAVSPAFAVDFNKEVKPILESACISCHGATKQEAELRLDTKEGAFKGSDAGGVIVPGKPQDSALYSTTVLPPEDEGVMPPKSKGLLAKGQTEVLRKWIAEGAHWPEGAILAAIPRVDFVKDVQPLLEQNCVSCHRPGHDEGGLRLDQRELAFAPIENGQPAIVPGDAAKSSLYTTTTLAVDNELLMPPKNKGGPLSREVTDILKNWINGGAFWPEGIVLVPRKKEGPATGDEPAVVAAIYQRITGAPLIASEKEMKPYGANIPGSDVRFDMVPIPSGKFKMGSSASEAGHQPDEGPQHEVEIAPFWMGKCEVTWNEFELFMYPSEEKKIRETRQLESSLNTVTDAVTRPTQPYVEMSFGMGKEGFPAISMTQHAANKYCQWLSAKTGSFYRLPTEAEWEYAARAGTTTAYYWGDDPAQIGEHAWWAKNSDTKYQKVGRKKPNPWGLHDIAGNVLEWCLDQYDPEFYKNSASSNPWNPSTKPYPHAARGGSWDDEDPVKFRSAVRRGSLPSWKIQDPQLPKSVWYHTDAQFLGFRVVRPWKVPPAEEMHRYWNSGVEKDDAGLTKAD